MKVPNSRTRFRTVKHFSQPNTLCCLRLALIFSFGLFFQSFCEAERVPIQLETQDGQLLSGNFAGIAGDLLRIEVAQDTAQKSAEIPAELPIRTLRKILFSPDLHSETVSTVPTPQKNSEIPVTVPPQAGTTGKEPDEIHSVNLGGSLLKIRSVTLKEGVFQLKLASGGNVTAKSGEIMEILFQESRLGKNKDLDADWEEIQNLETNEDLLVVFRNEKLNFYYGTILEMTDKAVRFEQDGESINVRLRHIFAIRFTTSIPSSASLGAPAEETVHPKNHTQDPVFREKSHLGILTDEFGSELSISSLELSEANSTDSSNTMPSNISPSASAPSNTAPLGEVSSARAPTLRCITTSGHVLDLPSQTLRTLDFTHGRTVFLADLKVESIEWTPYFPLAVGRSGTMTEISSSTPSAMSSGTPTGKSANTVNGFRSSARSEVEKDGIFNTAQKFYASRTNQGFSGNRIRLGGTEYANGLELTSRTKMVFRLPGPFRKFETTLGIDDFVRPSGSAEISILADERLLFRETITGKDAPKSLSLDISGARRLTLLVDYGDGGSLSDHAAFANAQLIK